MHTPPEPQSVPKLLNVVVTGALIFLGALNIIAVAGFFVKLADWCWAVRPAHGR